MRFLCGKFYTKNHRKHLKNGRLNVNIIVKAVRIVGVVVIYTPQGNVSLSQCDISCMTAHAELKLKEVFSNAKH